MDTVMRYLAGGVGGAVGGAALGTVIYASGASGVKPGKAIGFGALVGLGAGVLTVGAGDLIAMAGERSAAA